MKVGSDAAQAELDFITDTDRTSHTASQSRGLFVGIYWLV